MIKILVTGANGQLGSSIRFVSKNIGEFSFDYTDLNELNICNPSNVEDYVKLTTPNYIINCAAYTQVDKAESEPELCFKLNAEAVNNLKKAAKQVDSKIIHISTDYVFDGSKNSPYTEDDIPNPITVYGKSKLKGEEYLQNDPNAIIIRTAWLYSQFGNNFLKTIIRMGMERDTLQVVSDQIGCPTYAPDLAGGIISIIRSSLSSNKSFIPGIYNYTNEGVTSWFDFALEIVKLMKLNCKVMPIKTKEYPSAAVRPLYSVLSKTRICNTFSLEIPFWEDSLNSCIHHLK